MLNRILLAIFMLTSCLGFSDSTYSSLRKIFQNQGTLPTPSEISGWRSGRCYNFDREDVALGALLAVENVPSGNGPLFPDTKLIQTVVLSTDPGYFDTLTETNTKKVKEQIEKHSKLTSPLRTRRTSLSSLLQDDLGGMYGRNPETSTTKYKNYLVTEQTLEYWSSTSGWYRAEGRTCYFFKVVYPNSTK